MPQVQLLQTQAKPVFTHNDVTLWAYPHSQARDGYVFVFQKILAVLGITYNRSQWLDVKTKCSLHGGLYHLCDGNRKTRRVGVVDFLTTQYFVSRSRSEISFDLFVSLSSFIQARETLVTQVNTQDVKLLPQPSQN
jgi:hypothetical protein